MRKRLPAVLVLISALTVVTPGGPASGQERAAPEANLTGVVQVAAGYYNGCAILTNRQLRCWGYGVDGANGDGTDDTRNRAVTVLNTLGTGPLRGVRQVSVGTLHTCAVLTNDEARCWGNGAHGAMGNGTTTQDNLIPVKVENAAGTGPLDGVVQISAGDENTCAVLRNGQARCWGRNNFSELGDGTEDTDRLRPVAVRAVTGSGVLTDVTQVEMGDRHTCARLANGQARCWGDGLYGALGNGDEGLAMRPEVVLNGAGTGPLQSVRRISAGGDFSCATLTDDTARCWGRDIDGALGDGLPQADEVLLPVSVENAAGTGRLRGVSVVHAGSSSICARVARQLRCAGADLNGQLGNGPGTSDQALPVAVLNGQGTANLTNVVQHSFTAYTACALLTDRTVRCWGYGDDGQIGDGNEGDEHLPRRVQV